jgi:hypothetical protein
MRPTEPPPIYRALARTGENKRCIACLSFLMAICSPPHFKVLHSVRRATGAATCLAPGINLQMLATGSFTSIVPTMTSVYSEATGRDL